MQYKQPYGYNYLTDTPKPTYKRHSLNRGLLHLTVIGIRCGKAESESGVNTFLFLRGWSHWDSLEDWPSDHKSLTSSGHGFLKSRRTIIGYHRYRYLWRPLELA